MRRARGLIVGLGSCLTLLAFGATAGAVTIGANLNRPANNQADCRFLPTTDFAGFRQYFFHGIPTCTYMSAGDIRGREGAGAPAPGILVQARVKTGPFRTGPMRFTIMRAIRRRRGGTSCCFFAGQSQIFTPRSNAVNTLNVRLPMDNHLFPDPDVGERVDYLGLSVLGAGFPVPAFDGGVPGDINRPASFGFYPFIAPGDLRVDYSGVTDFIALINGEFLPLCGSAVGRAERATASGRGRCAPLVGIAGGIASRQGGRAVLAVLCNLTSACRGSVRLQSRAAAGGRASAGASGRGLRAAASARPTTYASGGFKLRAGGRAKVRTRLSRAGKKLLRGRAKARVWANVSLRSGRKSSLRITLRR